MISFIPNVATAAAGSLVFKGITYSFTIAASSYYDAKSMPYMAFDSNRGAGLSFGGAGGNRWVSIIYSSPILVNYMTMIYRSFASFKVQAWDGSSWIDIQSNITNANGVKDTNFEMEMHLEINTAYLGYRLYVLSGVLDGWPNISNLSWGVSEPHNFGGNEIIPMESDILIPSSHLGKASEEIKSYLPNKANLAVANAEENKFSVVLPKSNKAFLIEANKAFQTPNNKFSYEICNKAGLYGGSGCIGMEATQEFGKRSTISLIGMAFEKEELGKTNVHDAPGVFVEDQPGSIKVDKYLGFLEDTRESDSVPRLLRNFMGIDLKVLEENSYASNHYTLLVTATHQYRAAIVNVHAKTYGRTDFRGSYQLLINGTIAVDYSAGELDITAIDINLSSGQWLKGVNKCWLNIKHSNGCLEYLDFEVFKEEARRTTAERLFRDYDGGFDGEFWCPPKILNVGTPPCAMVPNYGDHAVITTTDFTNINLKNILSIQNLVATGKSLRILVSFDGRLTWSAFSANAWHTIDKTNIATSGMTMAVINAITEAQWGDVMNPANGTKGKALDVSVYIGNDISDTLVFYSINPTSSAFASFPTYPTKITQIISSAYANANASYLTVYSNLYPNGYSIRVAWADHNPTNYYYNVSPGEIVTGISFPNGYGHTQTTVYGKMYDSYLKSIKVNMTVNPFKGYAFII